MVNRSDSEERKALVLEVNRLLTSQPNTWGEPGDAEASINARKLALGLAFLRGIANVAMREMPMTDAKACGATEAHDLIEALVCGGDHPIFEYAQTLRTALPHRPKLAPAQTIIWALAIAGAKVLRNRFGCGAGESTEIIASRLRKLPSLRRKMTGEAIRKREERLDDSEKEILERFVAALLNDPGLQKDGIADWIAVRVSYYSEPAHLMTEPDLRKLGFKLPKEQK